VAVRLADSSVDELDTVVTALEDALKEARLAMRAAAPSGQAR
jgi:hypothetical protein